MLADLYTPYTIVRRISSGFQWHRSRVRETLDTNLARCQSLVFDHLPPLVSHRQIMHPASTMHSRAGNLNIYKLA